MSQTRINRRRFLAASATAAFGSWSAISYGRIKGANSRPRVAVIGLNGRGMDHVQGFQGAVAAICDCDSGVLARRAAEINLPGLQTFSDYRKLLEDPTFDCVSIATPNHTHSLIAMAALLSGKDVYVEKPVSHNVWEGRQLARMADRTQRICQCGTQSRSSPSLHQAREFLQSGALGRIEYALGTCYKPRLSIGRLNQPLSLSPEVDYDLWCGPAAMVPLYRPKLHYDWHWDFNTGNGDMGNQGIHQMDIARWFLGEPELSPRVRSIGGRLGYDDAGNTPNTQIVLHAYRQAPLIFETRGLPRNFESQVDHKTWNSNMDEFRGTRVGVLIQCEKGHLLIPNYTSASAFDRDGNSLQTWSGEGNHYQNFLEAVSSRRPEQLNAPVLEGHLSSALCHTGAVSHQVGELATVEEIRQEIAADAVFTEAFERMLEHLAANRVDVVSTPRLTLGAELIMNPAEESILNHSQASSRLSREYRKPFELPQA